MAGDVQISFDQLRMVVIAAHEFTTGLKETGCFSLGNWGNDINQAAKLLDSMISYAEKSTVFVVRQLRDDQESEEWRRKQSRIIVEWQEFAQRIAGVLRCSGTTDDIYSSLVTLRERMIEELQARPPAKEASVRALTARQRKALQQGAKALRGSSNDAEHDALYLIVQAFKSKTK